jgi:hypothetical protein
MLPAAHSRPPQALGSVAEVRVMPREAPVRERRAAQLFEIQAGRLRGRESEMEGQLGAHITLDDIYSAVQRVRDVVVEAETYTPEALHESLRPLMQEMAEAKVRLTEALRQLEEESLNAETERT